MADSGGHDDKRRLIPLPTAFGIPSVGFKMFRAIQRKLIGPCGCKCGQGGGRECPACYAYTLQVRTTVTLAYMSALHDAEI